MKIYIIICLWGWSSLEFFTFTKKEEAEALYQTLSADVEEEDDFLVMVEDSVQIPEPKEIIKNLYHLSCIAYWRDVRHCGSDYDPDGCQDCSHHYFCEKAEEIEKYLGGG